MSVEDSYYYINNAYTHNDRIWFDHLRVGAFIQKNYSVVPCVHQDGTNSVFIYRKDIETLLFLYENLPSNLNKQVIEAIRRISDGGTV